MIAIGRAIYVGLAGLVALAVWFFTKTSFVPPDAEKRRRSADPRTAELLRARKNIIRQIERQRSHSRRRSEFSDEGLERLKTILKEIEAELAERS